MNEKSSENDNGLEINVSDGINIVDSVGAEMGIVATVTTAINTVRIGFPITTSSEFIIQTAYEAGGEKWTLEEARLHAEKYDRARGMGKGGYKYKVGGTVSGGGVGAEVEIEKKPTSEMKMMADLIYKREEKST